MFPSSTRMDRFPCLHRPFSLVKPDNLLNIEKISMAPSYSADIPQCLFLLVSTVLEGIIHVCGLEWIIPQSQEFEYLGGSQLMAVYGRLRRYAACGLVGGNMSPEAAFERLLPFWIGFLDFLLITWDVNCQLFLLTQPSSEKLLQYMVIDYGFCSLFIFLFFVLFCLLFFKTRLLGVSLAVLELTL